MLFNFREQSLHLGLVEVFTWDLDLSEVGGEVRWDDPVDDSLVDNYDVYIAKVVTAADPCSDTFGDVDSQAMKVI